MMNKLLYSCTLVFFLAIGQLSAQQSVVHLDPQAALRDAVDLFEKEKFGAAQTAFISLEKSANNLTPTQVEEIHFFTAASAYYLGNSDTDELLSQFLEAYPCSIYQNQVLLMAANYRFERKSYKQAIKAYKLVDISGLSSDAYNKYTFRYGYCLFILGEYEEAKSYFELIQTSSSSYASDAKYYAAYIAYQEADYTKAKQLFESIQYDDKYINSVPFFLLNIYFSEGDYSEVIRKGPELYDLVEKNQRPEVARLISAAAFQKGDYGVAKQYLEYNKNATYYSFDRSEKYQWAYCLYKEGDYEEAQKWFERVELRKDSITQSTYYHIGDCQLKLGEKRKAQQSFHSAYKLDYDRRIREDALFNYAKLTYDLSYDPYNEAFSALQSYLSEYPNAVRSDEARQYLINLAMSTKNYSGALEALEQIKNKDHELLAAEQKITYLSGIALFEQKKYSEAIAQFSTASKDNLSVGIKAESMFWMAESYYRLGRYSEANEFFRRFLWTSGADALPHYASAYYNLGYISFKLQNYAEARGRFLKFLKLDAGKNRDLQRDTYLRLGDCEYLIKHYTDAIGYYDKVIAERSKDADYALYQKGMSLGAMNRLDQKVETMEELLLAYSASPYADDAYFEAGLALLIQNKNSAALRYFDELIAKKVNSNLRIKALLRKGLIHFNMGESEQALTVLKEIVTNYPHTPEAKEALSTIKAIYLDSNNVDSYFAYAKTVPFANVSAGSQDSLTYIAAENSYLDDQLAVATAGFEKYINMYPEGAFALNSRNYLSSCYERTGREDLAYEQYEQILKVSQNPYTEESAKRAAEMAFEKEDFATAANYFKRLEACTDNKMHTVLARYRLMQIYQKEDKSDSTITAAYLLLASDRVTEEMIVEAHFAIAEAAFKQGDKATAKREYELVTALDSGVKAAASAWYLAQMKYDEAAYDASLQAAFDLINDYPNYEYWLVKSYILLADNYAAQQNLFQAEQTLQSIVDNCKIEELHSEAQERLVYVKAESKKLEELENQQRDSLRAVQTQPDTLNR